MGTGPARAEYERRLQAASDIRDHLPVLYGHAARRPGVRILELGVRSGNSSSAFLAALEDSPAPGCLWSIDVNDPDVPGEWHGLPYWRFLRADDLSAEALRWAPESVDVLFIDTSHEYGHTLAELRAYAPRVARGGIVLMHDTEYAFADGLHLAGQDPHGSAVGRALDAYCAEAGLTWENRPGCYGLGMVGIP